MRLRTEIAERLHNELLKDVGEQERNLLDILLTELMTAGTLTREQGLALENAAVMLAVVSAEAAFLVGVEAGRDLRAFLCKQEV